ncbi:MAG: PKD domain-containing protein, partial [Candidatus Thermoplasmatota archaeon]|nr:PKD domain-containing protein [Candidatus Thermoplasmatota archaeon]
FEYLGNEIHLFGPAPEFIFKEIGYYEVNLTVTDREGNKSYGQMKVTVENYKEKVRLATILGIGFAGISFLGLMVWSFILEIKEKRIGRKKDRSN